MRFSDYLRYAIGAMLRIKVRSTLTVAGIMIGISASVLLVGFGEQAKRRVTEEFASQGSLQNITVISPKLQELARQNQGGRRKRDPDALKAAPALNEKVFDEFRKIPGVTHVFPSIFFECLLTRGESAFKGTATDLNPDVSAKDTVSKLAAGSYFSSDSAKEVILAEYMAYQLTEDTEELKDLIGKEVILNYFTFRPLGKDAKDKKDGKEPGNLFDRMERKQEPFKVVGIVRDGEYLATGAATLGVMRQDSVILPQKHAVRLYGLVIDPMRQLEGADEDGGRTYFIATVTVADSSPQNVRRIRDEIEARNYPTFHIYEMIQQIQIVFTIIQMFLGALGLIALFVASLQIINTMTMSILERTREIGVMKAIGARNRDVLLLFVTESVLMGLIGALLGVGLAWLFGKLLEWGLFQFWLKQQGELTEAPTLFAIPLWLFGVAVAFGVGVSLIASVWPAYRAAKIDPVRALRRD